MELPTKTVTGTTLEDRLTENAYQRILPSRYLRKDENGDVIESPEDLFTRVAKNVAVAEAVWADDDVTITWGEIKPEHPRRDELIGEVFDTDDNGNVINNSTELTEANAKWVAYDELTSRLRSQGWDNALEAVNETKEEFEERMNYLDFMPNSPTLMNAGDELQQLSACFVDSPEDDMEDIHETEKEAAQVFQSGGGMGYAFSRLRPYGDRVGSTGGIASGPITFMRTYDQMCRTIAQGGSRRGAQMGIMRVSHPDVIQFIHSKNKDVSLAHQLRLNDPKDPTHTSFAEALEEARELLEEYGGVPEFLRNAVEGHLANFNISVAVTDEFMRALKTGEDFTFTNPRTGEPHIATPETKELYGTYDLGEYVEVGEELSVPAQALWDKIIDGAHENGEPGVVFIDRINDEHSFPTESTPGGDDGEYEVLATNPCGEQPLMEYEACNLGHINLSTIVDEDAPTWAEFQDGAEATTFEQKVQMFMKQSLKMDELNNRVETGTNFLENVVTMSAFPIEEIEETVRDNRKIGLGIMGLAQMFLQLGVEYGSEEGDELARQVMRHINHESKRKSQELASERGVFPNWEDSKYANPPKYADWFHKQTGETADEWQDGYPIRNHNTTTIAPTGTTSMIGNTSGGCEPIHNVAYYKNVSQDVQGDEMLVEFDDYFLRVLEANNVDVEAAKKECQELMDANEYDGVDNLETVPDEIGELFVVTGDLSGIEHGSIQCALQEGVDSAISKTVNAPNEATKQDAQDAFEFVYDNGGKGVTYFRDGTRSKQVISTRKDNKEFADEDLSKIPCGCGDYAVFTDEQPEAVDVICPVCDNHFGFGDTETDTGAAEPQTAGQADRRPKARPKVTKGETHCIETGYGKMYVTINEDQSGLHEVFGTVGKSGGFTESMVESLCRQVSLSLRVGADVQEVISQLEDIRSPKPGWDEGDQISSIPDGIATALKRYLDNKSRVASSENSEKITVAKKDGGEQKSDVESAVESGMNPECPECGKMLTFSEGCQKCDPNTGGCGWSKC